jgi:photosystem II stability/assembly factor-like uncharacterized protein
MKHLIAILFLFLSVNILSQWVKQNPLRPASILEQIDFIDQNTGYAVGDSGVVLKTTNSGLNWQYIYLNTRSTLKDVDFVNANTGYICCGDTGKVFKTTDGGNLWNVLDLGTTGNNAIYFSDVNTGYVAGSTIVRKTTNGGINWGIQFFQGSDYMVDMFFINSQTGWINLVIGGIYKTTNGGTNWIQKGYGANGRLFFINENTGWVCHSFSGTVFKTINGGLNWQQQNAGYNKVYTVAFTDINTGWGAGSFGMVKTSNGGTNWINVYQSSDIQVKHLIFLNTQLGWGAGSTGDIIKTTNSGTNWNNVSPEIYKDIFMLKFFNENTGYISGGGGIFAVTTNGGLNWSRKSINTLQDITNYSFINSQTGWLLTYPVSKPTVVLKTSDGAETWAHTTLNLTKYVYGIHFANALTGWLCGDSGLVLKSINGGNNWLSQNINTNSKLFSIKSFDENKVVATSIEGGLYISSNGGANFQIVSGMENTRFVFIDILNSSTAYVSGFDTLIKTTNSGETWAIVSNNMGNFSKLINFVNVNTGYFIRDNFISKTNNGGLNWSGSQVPNIFYQLLSINFINENTGWVAGSLGDIFKTTSGNTIGINPVSNEIPKSFSLYQNYPNPFNPTTKISFDLPKSSFVELTIYDVTGRQISILVNEQLSAGKYIMDFNASNLPSGVYFYQIKSGSYTNTKKMVLIK